MLLLSEKGRRAAGGRGSAFFFAQRSKVGRVKYEENNFWVPQAVCVTGSSPCSGEPRRRKHYEACGGFFLAAACSLRCVSFYAKGHARLPCSAADALVTVRCRYQPFAFSLFSISYGKEAVAVCFKSALKSAVVI